MMLRLLILALGWKTTDSYEQSAGRAVRRYLLSLVYPVVSSLLLFPIASYGILRNMLPGVWMLAVMLIILTSFHIVFLLITKLSPYVRIRRKIPQYPLSPITRATLRMCERHRIPRVLVHACDTDTYPIDPYTQFHSGWRRIFMTQTLARNTIPARGIIAHELGHVVLPLGHIFFEQSRKALISIDNFVEYLDFVIEQRHMSTTGTSIVSMRVLRVVHRIAWYISSHRTSQCREYACDAISALILRSALPFVYALLITKETEALHKNFVSLSHPATTLRIQALLDIDWKSRARTT